MTQLFSQHDIDKKHLSVDDNFGWTKLPQTKKQTSNQITWLRDDSLEHAIASVLQLTGTLVQNVDSVLLLKTYICLRSVDNIYTP